ncbi:MAG: hypothetical protein H0U23_06185 [Blastocatellia bacterium]|nr:hypothetical protein [Blastocatellia bacterium]
MKTAIVVFGLVISFAVVSSGQARTITNSTLAQIQQKRLAAERNYRENYARLGFPSPEELDRQREVDMTARIELAEQLRKARLEKERLELERRSLDLETRRLETEVERRLETEVESTDSGGYYGGGYFSGYGAFESGFSRGRYPGRFRRGAYRRNRLLPLYNRAGGYRVTPFEVIPIPRQQTLRFRSGGGHRGRWR